MDIIKKLHLYFASHFWENPLSMPFYWPMQIFFAKIDPWLSDSKSKIKYKIFNRKVDIKPKIISSTVMSTFVCNARCRFCTLGHNTIEGKVPFMSQDIFKKAIDGIVEMGLTEINLTPTVGEVLLDRGFFEKVDYAKKKGLKILLHTNGYFLNMNDNYKKLVEAGIDDLTISLCDLNPKIESEVYNTSESSAKIKMEGIKNILELNKKERKIKYLRLHFRQNRHPHYVTQEPLFKELRKNYLFSFAFFFRIDNWGGAVKQKDLSKAMMLRTERKVRIAPCLWLDNICIHPDGKVRACGCRIIKTLNDELVIGDINNATLKEIVNNGRLEVIKKGFSDNKYAEVCTHCSVYQNK